MKKPRKLGQNSLATMRIAAILGRNLGTFLHGREKASSLVFFDEGTQSAQSFVPITRNLV